MDFDRLQRIFGRLLETHGMVFGGALAAIIVLIVLVALTRRQHADGASMQPAQSRR